MRLMGTLTLAAALLAACSSSSSGGGGQPLDCSFLASDNCWKTTVAAAASCLPAETDQGTLSADGKTCTYASGQVVTFDSPVVLPLPQGTKFNFTLANGGQTCLRFQETQDGAITVTTSAGAFNESVSQGSGSVTMTCPNGTSYSSSNPLMLLSCDAGAFGGLPGSADSSGGSSVTFSLLNAGGMQSGTVHIFTCVKM